MLHANEAITVIHHTRDAGGDRYTCHTFTGSWYAQLRAAVTTGGLQSAGLVKARIPATADSETAALLRAIAPGDRMIRGTLEHCTAKEFAALGRSGKGAALLAIHDNTRAIPPHVYLEGGS